MRIAVRFQCNTILAICVCVHLAFAQKNIPFRLGVVYHHGFLYNHSEQRAQDKGVSLSALNGAEVQLQWHTTGKKAWHTAWKYPFWGMSGLIFVVPAKRYGGNCYAWLIYMGTALISTPRYEFRMRMGTGVGTFESPYHPVYNPENLWVSAPLNLAMHMQIDHTLKINDSLFITFGGSFAHFSNGAVMMPNLGVNYPTVQMGFYWYPNYQTLRFSKDTLRERLPRWYGHIGISGGTKVLPDFGTTYYAVYHAFVQVGYRLTGIYKPIAGFDVFRDESLLADSVVRVSGTDIHRLGAFFGNEFLMGRLSMFFGLGGYLYKRTERDAAYYLRVGLRWHFYKNIFASLALKTHWGQADSFEWSLGYTIK